MQLEIRGDLCLADSHIGSVDENGFHEKVLKLFLFAFFFAKEKSNRIPFSQLQLKIGFQSNFSASPPPFFFVCILLARNKMKKKMGQKRKENRAEGRKNPIYFNSGFLKGEIIHIAKKRILIK